MATPLTQEQRKRIQNACQELSAALTHAGHMFDIDWSRFEAVTYADNTNRWVYKVNVDHTHTERI